MLQRHTTLAVAALCLLAVSLPCQRKVKKLTKKSEPHTDARISPDGKFVAFLGKGQQKIGVVDSGGVSESTLVTSSSLGGFVWAPNSAGIYYLDGVEVKFVAKSGGQPTSIGKGTGTLFLSCVDRSDKTIYGYRRDSKNGTWHVFSLSTSGSASPKDIVTIAAGYWVTEVAVDFSGKKLAYLMSLQRPFASVDVVVADNDGKNPKSWTGKNPLKSPTRNLAWADLGQTVVFSTLVVGTLQIGRLTAASSTVQFLTSGPKNHQGSSTGRNLSWIVFQGQAQQFRAVPGVMPTLGGGRVLLEPEDNWRFRFAPGAPAATIDAAGQNVAFAASLSGKIESHVYLVKLDREIRITPRAVPGGKIDVSLPVDKDENGILFLAFGLLPKPAPLTGFVYGVAIDPGLMIQVLSGKGDGKKPLQLLQLQIPSLPALKGFTVFLQGVRTKNGTTGDLTRYLELQIQ